MMIIILSSTFTLNCLRNASHHIPSGYEQNRYSPSYPNRIAFQMSLETKFKIIGLRVV